jgi:excisionase family DNA binding protein
MHESTVLERPPYMTVAEAHARVGKDNISRSAFYEAVKRNEIPTIRIGKRVLVIRGAFERLLTGSPSPKKEELVNA